jgi:3-hydroxyisobutyrate dehydrogenase
VRSGRPATAGIIAPVMRIAMVGLGTMGAPMARHLLEAGHDVTVHNRTREREEPPAELGAERAANPREAARDAEVLVVCVSDTPDVEEVLFGRCGAVQGLPEGSIVVDVSTISPTATRDMCTRLSERGVGHVDAPVSGGSEGAERGTLTIFVGGQPDNVERVRPLLETFGSRVTHLGPSGSGQLAKAVNQVMLAGMYTGVAEGVALAEAAGLPLDELVEALGAGAVRSWVLENRAANMIRDDYPLGFKLALHRKDLRIGLEEARLRRLHLAVTSLVAQEEDSLMAQGFGDEDVSAVARAAKRRVD